MSKQNDERNETLTVNGVPYVALTTYANANDMNPGRLRRYVRNTDNAPARKFGNTWLIERDCDVVLPATKSRGKTRADGRQRFVVYVAPCVDGKHDELQQIMDIVGVDNVTDPRERAKQRRIDKSTAATNG